MADHTPLSPAQRRQAIAWVSAQDEHIGEMLATELELDPTVRLLLRGVEAIRDQAASDARETRQEVLAELRAMRWQVVGVVVLALCIQAGMVGLSISVGAVGPLPSVDVAPATLQITPAATEADDQTDPSDDAAWAGDTAYDAPGPRPMP